MALPKHGIETSLREFFKATIAGGLLFLLPVVLILIVLRHAMRLAVKVTKPISDLLPVEAVLGVRASRFPRSTAANLNLVGRWPRRQNERGEALHAGARLLSGRSPAVSTGEEHGRGPCTCRSAEGVQPALVSIEDGWQIAYLLEPLENYCISAAGAYPYVGQRECTLAGELGTATEPRWSRQWRSLNTLASDPPKPCAAPTLGFRRAAYIH